MKSESQSDVQTRCGMVSIVGRPNVGKSTLLNTLVGEKITIVSKVPQTTRNKIRGIYTEDRGQIIFIDTPGLYLGKDKLDKLLTKSAFSTLHDADCVIHLVDITEPVGPEEEEVVSRLKTAKMPIILGLNKIDLKGRYIPEYISLWERAKGKPFQDIGSIVLATLSGKNKKNINQLFDLIFERLPISPLLYEQDIVTDVPQKIAISDIIREKFLLVMKQEVPHSIAIQIESIERKKYVLYIRAIIFVERDSQKEIVIGKGGQVLKKIGTAARAELEELMDTKVFLELTVKHQSKWRDNLSFLTELGYDSSQAG